MDSDTPLPLPCRGLANAQAELWGGRLLLHKELEKSKLARSSKTNMNRLRSQAGRGSLSEDPSTEIVAKPSPAAWKPAGTPALSGGCDPPHSDVSILPRAERLARNSVYSIKMCTTDYTSM